MAINCVKKVGACQNQFPAPLILQGWSLSGLSKIRFVCV